jgi:signal transduction histidine kinase
VPGGASANWGLGLHITRQIVEHMYGTIGFDSEVGQGTTFWIDLPAEVENVRLLS